MVHHNLSFILLSVFLLTTLCCRPEEYSTEDGQCCPMCREGTVVTRHCTVDSGTRCGPCTTGTYMNEPNGKTQCLPCSICHPAQGLSVRQPCSPSSNSVCGVSRGFFCKHVSDVGSCEQTQKHSVCVPGQKVAAAGTESVDTKCENCTEETFSPEGINCTAWTRCSATQVLVRAGSRTEDALCSSASRKFYGTHVSLALTSLLSVALVLITVRARRKS